MEARLEEPAAKDGERVADVADRVSGERLHVLPRVRPGRHDLQAAEAVVQECLWARTLIVRRRDVSI